MAVKKMTMNEPNRTLSIRLTFHDNRLNITKNVLYALGKPSWVQVLISKDRKTMFIKRCDTKLRDSFFVPPRVYNDPEYKYRLRKAAFSEAVCKAQGWNEKDKFRLYGFMVADGVIGFHFNEAVSLNDTEEDELAEVSDV
jgi:hypothetical protein